MRWIVKAGIQGLLSQLPASQRWNYWFQRNFGSLTVSPVYVSEKLSLCNQHLVRFRQFSASHRNPASVLELGSGWLPIVPIGFRLAGIEQVVTIDIQRLSNSALLTELLHTLRRMTFPEIKSLLPDAREAEYQTLIDLLDRPDELSVEQLGIDAIIGDARKMRFSENSFDFIVSNNTLEHIPAEVIDAIFIEFRRVLVPDGLMCHLIDMQDHYSYFDRSITVYRFLEHGDRVWRLVNNSLQYQNRLRVSDYRAFHKRASFEIIDEQTNPGDPGLLRLARLSDAFREYSITDLAATQSWMLSRVRPDVVA